MIYRFNHCELNTDSRELVVDGHKAELEPQVFDLLVFLAENRNKVISRDELVEHIWKGRVVSDSAITSRISAARKAVGDSGKHQIVIKTIPRKGFRFLPDLERVDVERTEPGVRDTDVVGRMESQTVQKIRFCTSSDQTRIAYAVTGEGSPLIRTGHWLTHLEHDWNSPIWRPFLDELGKHFEVTRYDQRGCGLTDRDIEDFSFRRYVEDLNAVVSASGHERVILYATSQGVPVAIDYATRHPERVSHLICLGGYARGRLVRSRESDVEQGEAILKLIKHGWGVDGSPFIKSFATNFIPDGSREQIESLTELQRVTTNPANALSIRRAADQFDVSEQLSEVAVKSLVLHANNDGIHPLDEGRDVAAGIPDCQFVLLQSNNHALLPQEPAWRHFFEEIQRFTEN